MKIDFEFQTSAGLFRDAITLPDDHGLTDEQIESMKIQRRDAWVQLVTSPPEDPQIPEGHIMFDGVLYKKA